MTVRLFNYAIAEAPLERLVERVVDHVSRGGPRLRLFAMNPAKVALAERDPRLDDALRRAEILYPDGYGICLASRMMTGRRLSRVPGVELATALVAEAARRGWGVYLLGARPEVNDGAARALQRRFSDLRVVGSHHGYFDRGSDGGIVNDVNRAQPDLLLVALGSPAQEIWIDRRFRDLRVTCALGLGGTFDVWAGHARRAPAIFRRVGLEWLYRIAREPRRAGRFLRTHPRFFAKVLRDRLASGRQD